MIAILMIAAADPGLLAVLELKNKLKGEDVDAGYLADEVRSAALKTLPGLRVMTHENMQVLLSASGKKLEDCEGECEVDTGRRIGADYVVSGELLKFGTHYKLDLKLHETADGRLLAGAIASGATVDELDAATAPAVRELLAPLVKSAPAAQPSQPPAAPAQQRTAQTEPSQRAPSASPPPARTAALPSAQQAMQAAAQERAQIGDPRRAQAAEPMRVADRPVQLRRGKSGIEYVQIPEGVAHLGCASFDEQCQDNEKPGRTAKMPSFWLTRSEVTAAQYGACWKAKGCSRVPFKRDYDKLCNWKNKRGNYPMNCVTWTEAQAFCEWAGGRLPTAGEWEYAAKGGEDIIYPWGNAPPDGTRANFCDRSCAREAKTHGPADLNVDDGYAATAPVGSYPKGTSKWGLHDMAGNVSEWTASSWNEDREVRGGNWSRPAQNLRASHRFHAPVTHNDAATGFRCIAP